MEEEDDEAGAAALAIPNDDARSGTSRGALEAAVASAVVSATRAVVGVNAASAAAVVSALDPTTQRTAAAHIRRKDGSMKRSQSDESRGQRRTSLERKPPPQLLPLEPMQSSYRETLAGTWILDKHRGEPGMRSYLETMGVMELAIEAHEKGEAEHDTLHEIVFEGLHSSDDDDDDDDDTEPKVKIKKLSRVNDLTVEYPLDGTKGGVPRVVRQGMDPLTPGGKGRVRETTVMSPSQNPKHHFQITSTMPTMNGVAHVVDDKVLRQDNAEKSVLVQTLTIRNESTGRTNTTVRYFNPHPLTIEAILQAKTLPPASSAAAATARASSKPDSSEACDEDD